MAQSPEYALIPNAFGQQSTESPVTECFQHTSDDKIPLTEAEFFDPEQHAAGSNNMQYPEPPPSYLQSEGTHKQYPPASYVTNPQQPHGSVVPPPHQLPVMTPPQQPYGIVAQPPPVVIAPVNQPPATVVVVGSQALTPGTCSVCRKGQIKKSPSCCSYCWCILLLPVFIIPGIIALFCCCQKPKCTHCRYSP